MGVSGSGCTRSAGAIAAMTGATFVPLSPIPPEAGTDKSRVHDTLCGVAAGGGNCCGRPQEGAVNLAKRLAKSGNLQKPSDGRN